MIGGDTDDFEEEFSGGVIGTATAGYRFQRPQGGFVFRAGFTPFFDQNEFLPFAGISFGYAW